MTESEDYVTVLEKVSPAHQESLDCENIPDPMEGEQTWPTEEELAEGRTLIDYEIGSLAVYDWLHKRDWFSCC